MLISLIESVAYAMVRRAYNAVVVFKDIEENQIKHMRYRKKDMAVVHKGILNTSNVIIKKLV